MFPNNFYKIKRERSSFGLKGEKMKSNTYNISKIKDIINKYEYVSFDIFDTLIKRNVEKPEDVFILTQKIAKDIYKIEIENFFEKRKNAEEKAKKIGKINEPNIDEIYQYIDVKKQKEKLKEIEIQVEFDICQKNIDFFDIYQYCCKKNKKIIITSDMYLNREYIVKILEQVGIKHYNYLFVSNDIRLSKNKGNIYPYIMKKLNIKNSQIVHIGDSKKADYLVPMKYGIRAILIHKKINKLRYYDKKEINKDNNETFFYSIIEKFINNNMSIEKSEYYKIGYETLGILLYGYTKWLIEKLQRKNIKKIYFLAREGALLKEAFDLLNNTDIESRYLYVSRRSTRVSLLKDIKNLEDVFEIVKMRKIIDINSFFKSVGLEISKYKELLDKYKCKPQDNILNIKEFDTIFDKIKNDIKSNAKNEEKNLLQYLKQEEVEGNIAVADVGWVGTMQNALTKIINQNSEKCDIFGFYMGQAPNAKKFIEKGMKNEAYLFSYNQLEEYKKIRAFLNLFESFFLAQHGTTIGYKLEKNVYVPILDEIEYSKDEIEKFKEIQDGAIEFIKEFNKFKISNRIIEPNIAWKSICKLGLKPSLYDIKLFGKISYLETIKVQFANPKSIFYYIFNFKKMYIDFCNCSWKIGFLKKLFKIDLPYYEIYRWLYKE